MTFVFALAAFVQISFWMAIGAGIRRAGRSRSTSPGPSGGAPGISVLVAVRDAAEDIPGLIASLRSQRYSDFEVVLIDDGSVDASPSMIREAIEAEPRFSLIQNRSTVQGKKGAISTGLQHARADVIAVTDADCRPGPEWLTTIGRTQKEDPAVLVGYGPYAQVPSFLNRLIRFETLTTGMLTASAVGWGVPYMAVGRNLSYPRDVRRLSRETRGATLLSGDDDLLVQAARRAGMPVRYLFDPDSFVPSRAPTRLGAWLRQKRRHFSSARAYDLPAVLGLGAFHVSLMLCWIAPIALGWIGLIMLASKLVFQWPVVRSAAARFGEPGVTALMPVLEPLLTLIQLGTAPLGVLFPPRQW